MTAITSRPLSASSDSLLRFAIRADATLCGGVGLLVAMAADPLSRLSGLTSVSEWLGGAALVGYGVALYVLAAVRHVGRIGIGIVVGNVVFAVASLGVLISGVLPLTGQGQALLLATVAATLGMSYLQYLGVRRLA